MRRIQPPQCTSCRSAAAAVESDRWPSLRLCQSCQRDALEYILNTGVTHGNPMLLELAAPQGNDLEDSRLRIWRRSGVSVFRECWVNFESESQINFENPLDILDPN